MVRLVLTAVFLLALARGSSQAQDSPPEEREKLGLAVVKAPDGIRASGVMEGSPADRSGIKPGDFILTIDGAPTGGLSSDEFVRLVFQKIEHTFTVQSPNEKLREITIRRVDDTTFGKLRSLQDSDLVGKEATDFAARTPDGKEVRLSSYRGRPVLIHFTSTWCAACKAQLPDLIRFFEEDRQNGLKIVSVYLDDPSAFTLEKVERKGLSWPVHLNGRSFSEGVALAYQITAIPTNVLVGQDGKILRVQHTLPTDAELKSALQAH